ILNRDSARYAVALSHLLGSPSIYVIKFNRVTLFEEEPRKNIHPFFRLQKRLFSSPSPFDGTN
ncbi:unnamed protein product, partial [marine sediment metagenome]